MITPGSAHIALSSVLRDCTWLCSGKCVVLGDVSGFLTCKHVLSLLSQWNENTKSRPPSLIPLKPPEFRGSFHIQRSTSGILGGLRRPKLFCSISRQLSRGGGEVQASLRPTAGWLPGGKIFIFLFPLLFFLWPFPHPALSVGGSGATVHLFVSLKFPDRWVFSSRSCSGPLSEGAAMGALRPLQPVSLCYLEGTIAKRCRNVLGR